MRFFRHRNESDGEKNIGYLVLFLFLVSISLKHTYISLGIEGAFSSVLAGHSYNFPLVKVLYFCLGIFATTVFNNIKLPRFFATLRFGGILNGNNSTNLILTMTLLLALAATYAMDLGSYGIVSIKGALTVALLRIRSPYVSFSLALLATFVTGSKFFLLLPLIGLLHTATKQNVTRLFLVAFYGFMAMFAYSIFAPNALAYNDISLVQAVLRRLEVLEVWSLFQNQAKLLCQGASGDWIWAPGSVFSEELREFSGIYFGGSVGPSLPGQLYCLGVPTFLSWFLPGALLPILFKNLLGDAPAHSKAVGIILVFSVLGGLNLYHFTYYFASVMLYVWLMGTRTD